MSSSVAKPPVHRAHGPAAIRKLVAAMAVSSFGDGLVAVALPLLALRLTSSPLLIGGLAAMTRLPWLVVGLPAGVVVDRFDRRLLVLVVDGARAIIVALVALLAALRLSSLAELYAAATLLGTGETIVYAASRSVVPRAASGDDMVKANGRVSAAQTASLQFAGPAAGGALYALQRPIPFLGDALSYVASALLLRGAVADADKTRVSALIDREPSKLSVRADLRAGVRWFARSAPLRTLAATVSSFSFCQAVVLGVLVVYATHELRLSASGYGVFLALAAVGDVLGSLVAAKVHKALRTYATVLAAGTVAALGYLVLGSTHDRLVAVLGLALEAAATSIGNVATVSARYRIIPPQRFGVVSNAFRMFVVGVAPLGALLGGGLASAFGTGPTFLAAGAFQLAALWALALPLRSIAGVEHAETALGAR